MTIDFTSVLTKINGDPMQRAKDKTPAQMLREKAAMKSGKTPEEIKVELEMIGAEFFDVEDLTLAYVAGEALLNTLKGEEGISGAERYDRRKLAKRVYDNAQDFSAVEIEKIKGLIELAFDHRGDIVAAAFELLEKR